MDRKDRLQQIFTQYERLVEAPNREATTNGVWTRYENPVLTAAHTPPFWRYDLDCRRNPLLVETFGINAVFNAGAIRFNGKYVIVARVEGADRKSFFAIAQSERPTEGFRFRDRPILLPETDDPDVNVYDMRLTAHQDGWIYGIFCTERKDPAAPPSDTSSAVAAAGIVRTRDLKNWERLPDLQSDSQQRNVVLHPEFVDGRYALYTRPQDGFIDAGTGGGICWTLVDDICNPAVDTEKLVEQREYHTIKEVKNGQGPPPIKTPYGWLHMAHGVRNCASGLRYVLYMFMTALEDPSRVIAAPAGYFMAPEGPERVGDVSNVLFCNGWIADDDGGVYIYYASSDTCLHVASSTIERLVAYCTGTRPDGLRTGRSVQTLLEQIDSNLKIMAEGNGLAR